MLPPMVIERIVGNPSVVASLLAALLWAVPVGDGLHPSRGPELPGPASAKAHLPSEPFQDLQRYAAERLLSATDADDLSGRMDQLLDDPEYNALLVAASQQVPAQVLRELQANAAESEFNRFPGRHSEQARLIYRMMVEEVAAIVRLRNDLPVDSVDSERLGREPLAFLTDETFPVEAKEALLARSRVAAYAAAFGAPRYSEVPEWLVRDCLDRWAADEATFMRLLAAIPEARISPQVIPVGDRLDLERVVRDHGARDVVYQADLATARALDSDIFPDPDTDVA